MTRNDDPLFEALRRLPELSPDPARANRTRARCRQQILGRAQRKRVAMRVLDCTTAAALCVYLASVLQAAFRLAIGV